MYRIGSITRLEPYGAFVPTCGMNGTVPPTKIREIIWGRMVRTENNMRRQMLCRLSGFFGHRVFRGLPNGMPKHLVPKPRLCLAANAFWAVF